MDKLSQDEIRALALEAAKTIKQGYNPPFNRFDDEVNRLYSSYIRAKEIIAEKESME